MSKKKIWIWVVLILVVLVVMNQEGRESGFSRLTPAGVDRNCAPYPTTEGVVSSGGLRVLSGCGGFMDLYNFYDISSGGYIFIEEREAPTSYSKSFAWAWECYKCPQLPACSNGEKMCLSDKKVEICSNGQWALYKTCGSNEYCKNGACVTTSCIERWGCSGWSSCSNNQQTRTCSDANSCGTTTEKPSTTQSCTPGGGTTGDDNFKITSITAPTSVSIGDTLIITASVVNNGGGDNKMYVECGLYDANTLRGWFGNTYDSLFSVYSVVNAENCVTSELFVATKLVGLSSGESANVPISVIAPPNDANAEQVVYCAAYERCHNINPDNTGLSSVKLKNIDLTGSGGGANCENSAVDGDETDMNCGGSCPDKCPLSSHCGTVSDCVSGLECVNNLCINPTDTCPAGQVKCSDGSCKIDCGSQCPQGQTRCGDGSCKASCEGIPNIIVSKQPEVKVSSPSILTTGTSVTTTVGLKNTGADMTSDWLVEMQVVGKENNYGYYSSWWNPFDSKEEYCNPNYKWNVHKTFKLSNNKETTITLTAKDLAEGKYSVYLFTATDCSTNGGMPVKPYSVNDQAEPFRIKTDVCVGYCIDETEEGGCKTPLNTLFPPKGVTTVYKKSFTGDIGYSYCAVSKTEKELKAATDAELGSAACMVSENCGYREGYTSSCVSPSSIEIKVPIGLKLGWIKFNENPGFCLATPTDQSGFCEFASKLALFKITDDECTDGTIILFGGIFLLFIIMRMMAGGKK